VSRLDLHGELLEQLFILVPVYDVKLRVISEAWFQFDLGEQIVQLLFLLAEFLLDLVGLQHNQSQMNLFHAASLVINGRTDRSKMRVWARIGTLERTEIQ
jgi:hypothetical protein